MLADLNSLALLFNSIKSGRGVSECWIRSPVTIKAQSRHIITRFDSYGGRDGKSYGPVPFNQLGQVLARRGPKISTWRHSLGNQYNFLIGLREYVWGGGSLPSRVVPISCVKFFHVRRKGAAVVMGISGHSYTCIWLGMPSWSFLPAEYPHVQRPLL